MQNRSRVFEIQSKMIPSMQGIFPFPGRLSNSNLRSHFLMPLLTQLLKVIVSTESQKTQMGITLNTEKGDLTLQTYTNWGYWRNSDPKIMKKNGPLSIIGCPCYAARLNMFRHSYFDSDHDLEKTRIRGWKAMFSCFFVFSKIKKFKIFQT